MRGKVKFYSSWHHYGFIVGEDGRDYFVHRSQIIAPSGFRNLLNESGVTFRPSEGHPNPIATRVQQDILTPEDRVPEALRRTRKLRELERHAQPSTDGMTIDSLVRLDPARVNEDLMGLLELLESIESQSEQDLRKNSSPLLEGLGTGPLEIPDDLAGSLSVLAKHLDGATLSTARILSLRFFGGLTLQEVAERTNQSLEGVLRDWDHATHWLRISQTGAGRALSQALITLAPIDVAALKVFRDHPNLLRTLDWRSFEKLLAEVLERLGYEIELQRGTKDGGIDIFALRQEGAFGSHRYIIQAKRSSHSIGVSPVRELLFLQGHLKTSKACLATTACFTKGAWQLASEYNWQLELRDLEGIRRWIEEATRS